MMFRTTKTTSTLVAGQHSKRNRMWLMAAGAALLICAAAVAVTMNTRHAHSPLSYPRVAGVGGVLAVPDTADKPSPALVHRVFLDIDDSASSHHGINDRLVKAARFLNLYATAGVPANNVQVALIFYGKNITLALSDAAYKKKFGHLDSNRALLATLGKDDVQMFACGQTLANAGYKPEDVRPGVTIALSALTEREELQSAGYNFVP